MEDHESMRNFFYSSAKLIVSDSDINKAFGSIHESVMTKIKNYVIEDCIVKAIVEHGIKIFEC